MWRGGVRLQMVEALPFLDDDKGVGAVFGAGAALGVDHRAVFDAAGLGMDRRHVGAEMPEHFVALAGFGGDDCDDVDHGALPSCRGGADQDARAASMAALLFSIAIRPLMPWVRIIEANSARRVANSLIEASTYTSPICPFCRTR